MHDLLDDFSDPCRHSCHQYNSTFISFSMSSSACCARHHSLLQALHDRMMAIVVTPLISTLAFLETPACVPDDYHHLPSLHNMQQRREIRFFGILSGELIVLSAVA